MSISVIVPAHDAAATIRETLDALCAQTYAQWESIVVDDGSADDTAVIVERYVEREPRIRLIRQAQAGEGGARNAALAHARHPWLLFLDADDWIAPGALERWAAAVAGDPSLDAVHAGWIFIDPRGRVFGEHRCEHTGDLFPYLAEHALFPVHACLVRREIVQRIGGFDTTLKTCADWDMWQRVARTGARFGAVPDLLSWYRMRPNATWTGSRQYVRDGLRLVTQGHGPDPRVAEPASRYAEGLPRENLSGARLMFLCRPAAMELARGGTASDLLDEVPDAPAPDLSPVAVAHTMFHAAPLPACGVAADWRAIWPAAERELRAYLERLEARAGACGLARRARTEIERLVLEQAVRERPATVGSTHAIRLEVTEPLVDVEAARSVERLACTLAMEGEPLGVVQLPVFDGVVPAAVLADAIVAEHAWRILGRWFARTLFPSLELSSTDGRTEIRRGSITLGTLPSEGPRPFWDRAHDRVGWLLFLQELWDAPGSTSEEIYGGTGHLVGPERRTGLWTIIEASETLPTLVTSAAAVLVVLSAGGRALDGVHVVPRRGRISPGRLRGVLTASAGMELCRVAVREALLGVPVTDTPATLRERLRVCARELPRVAVPTQGLASSIELVTPWTESIAAQNSVAPQVVLARRMGPPGSSVSRRAALPLAAAPHLKECAAATGELAISTPSSVARAVYAPGLLWRDDTHGVAAAQEPSVYERARGWIAAAMAKRSSASGADVVTERLPILMYHRIAVSGAPATARYRLAPEAFEAQLAMLRDEGFESVDLESWRRAREARRPLPGRGIVFTFDDGCRDFATHAWPLLRRYGFTASVFVVSDFVGATSAWDARRGEKADLLDWSEIEHLAREGATFGAHGATHRRLSGLAPEEIVAEAARSRAVLSRRLGAPVDTIAYPHGASDAIVHHVAGACGFRFGLSCEPGRADYDAPLLALPRIEMRPDMSLAELRTSLGLEAAA